jgi:hypothetical protein
MKSVKTNSRFIMKNLFFLLLTTAMFSSCLPESSSSSSSSSSSNGDNGTVTSGTTGTTGTTGTNGTTGTTGTNGTNGTTGTTGSSGGGFPINSFNIFLAGTQSGEGGGDWYARNDNTGPLMDTFINLQEAAIAFKTDGTLRVRLKVNAQPVAPTNETYCYGRTTGSALVPYYTKLKFDLALRDIYCLNGGTTCPASQYRLGSQYRRQIGVGPVSVGSYSEIIDVGSVANQNVVATTVEVSAVKSDQWCASTNGKEFCPSEKAVRTKDCYNMELEVQTSYTESF